METRPRGTRTEDVRAARQPARGTGAQPGAPQRRPGQPAQGRGAQPGAPQRRTDQPARGAGAPQKPRPARRPLSPRQRRRGRVRRAAIMGVLAVVLLGAALLVSAKVLFKIETITVQSAAGDLPYSDEQIAAAFGHKVGENLFSFSIAQAQESIASALPYLENVRVERHLPDTVTVTAEPAVEESVIESSFGWVVLSKNKRVLRLCSEPPEGLVRVDGARADTPTPGQPVKLTEKDKLPILHMLLEKTAAQGLVPIEEVDMTNTLEISILYQGRIRIVLGTEHDMDYKLDWAWRMVTPGQTSDSLGENERGTLDVSSRGEDGLGRARWRAGDL